MMMMVKMEWELLVADPEWNAVLACCVAQGRTKSQGKGLAHIY